MELGPVQEGPRCPAAWRQRLRPRCLLLVLAPGVCRPCFSGALVAPGSPGCTALSLSPRQMPAAGSGRPVPWRGHPLTGDPLAFLLLRLLGAGLGTSRESGSYLLCICVFIERWRNNPKCSSIATLKIKACNQNRGWLRPLLPRACPAGCGVWAWCPAHLWEPLGASCPRGVRVQDACCGPADRRLDLGQGSPLGVSVSGMEKGV